MDEPTLAEPTRDDREGRLSDWGLRLGLALLPIVAAILGYYRQVGPESAVWQLQGDQVFYGYQITRAAETNGRWWKIADDRRLGWPYQSDVANHPALFEGIDLLLIATLSARLLDPTHNYHFLVLVVLAINGWVAGWLVRRLTGSWFWSALAILLITWNEPTSFRITGHLHLFKYGWLLLAVWAFARYLDTPSRWRGVVLGLSVALVLQGSFYYAYFLVLTLGTWWLGCLFAGKLDRRHVGATFAAAAVFLPAAAVVTFPVWTIVKGYLLADQFSHHPWRHTWVYSSEPWQWLVSQGSRRAARYIASIRAKDAGFYYEGWSFPGYTVLAGIAVYGLGRLRGRRFCDVDASQRFLDLVMGQVALLVGLSLPGGPSYFLYPLAPSMRCYGRAGMMGLVGLGCVAAPVILHGLTRGCRFRSTRALIVAAAVALVATDGARLQAIFKWPSRIPDPTPAWVDWLAKQPPRVKLAALGPLELNRWYGNLVYALRHGHTCLNGGDFSLLEGDLRLLGASYERMNPDGLRFIASLGYETLAIHRNYLARHPWIRSLAWLERGEEVGDWLIYRATARFPRIPAVAPGELLARRGALASPVAVPPESWITGQLDLGRTVMVAQPARCYLAWADASGRLVSEPCAGLYQHVYGPDLPAYTIRTPRQRGAYQLVFLDGRRRRIGAKPYLVTPKLVTSRQVFGRRPPEFTFSALTLRGDECRGDRLRVVLENKSPYYIQAHAWRPEDLGSARTHPGMAFPVSGSVVLELNYFGGETINGQGHLVLPHDLPPHGRLAIDLPICWRDGPDPSSKLQVVPRLLEVEQKIVPEQQGDLALSLEAGPPRLATTPGPSPSR